MEVCIFILCYAYVCMYIMILCSSYISNLGIPGLMDFLRSYFKLCRILANEICIKYSVELSDLELEDINIDDDDNDSVQIIVTETESLNGMSMF